MISFLCGLLGGFGSEFFKKQDYSKGLEELESIRYNHDKFELVYGKLIKISGPYLPGKRFKMGDKSNKCSYCRSKNSFINGNCKNCGGPEDE